MELQLVTIVGESVLEDRLIREITNLGAKGCTVSDVRGEGSRGARKSEFGGGNVKIETIVRPDVADAIMKMLEADFFPYYALIAYIERVQVLRGEKYS